MENRQTSALFREQAVAHAANNLLGKVLVTPKPSSIVISVFLLFWFQCFLVPVIIQVHPAVLMKVIILCRYSSGSA